MEIIVIITEKYGTRRIEPVCPKAILFAEIAGTKTLTDGTIERIKKLGYTVKVQPQPTEL